MAFYLAVVVDMAGRQGDQSKQKKIAERTAASRLDFQVCPELSICRAETGS